jgi:predicted Zn-ribbon and HTH transcriptional regulator
VADRNGIPLTMEAGEITLKSGALAQFTGYASANNAIALKGGTLTVANTVTKIIGSVASENGQRAAIHATGGVLNLQGNTLLDGGLTMSGDAQLKNKLTAGTFTNSGSESYSVSVEGSNQYTTVFDLLETGYAFAEYDADNEGNTTGAVIARDTTRELTEDVTVIKCTHKGANNKSLFKDNTCTGCGFTCAHKTVEKGVCTVCNQQMEAQDNTGKYYLNLAEAFEGVANGGTVTMLTTLENKDTISFCCDAEGNPYAVVEFKEK